MVLGLQPHTLCGPYDEHGPGTLARHVLAFGHFGAVPQEILYHNMVERFIQTYGGGFLRYLEEGLGIQEMDQRVETWIDGLMDKPLGKFRETRRERLEGNLKAVLRLPAADFGIRKEKILRVSREPLVTYRNALRQGRCHTS